MSKRLFIVFLSIFSFFKVDAAHLVGGEISYECLGNHDYEITLTIYRDCFSTGAAFDVNAVITVFDENGNIVNTLLPLIAVQNGLPNVAPNNCTSLPANVCTEKAIYRSVINLPPAAGGYTITHQRCCRNATINNIPNPDTWGNTYTIEVPPFDNSCNSSPAFNSDPPLALCINQDVQVDFSATETDGDSVFYTLCEFYHGGGQNAQSMGFDSPRPDPAAPPPYAVVPFNPFLNPAFPIPASPAFSVDPISGLLTGKPTQIGQYVFAVCAEEWRGGVLLSTLRRDFQFNVTGACQAVLSGIQSQQANPDNLCSGKTINFNENCINTNSYYWDFGDPASTNDNSQLANPVYTYTDTGTFRVMLVAEPGSSCADTSYTFFDVVAPPAASFSFTGDPCFDVHSFDFVASGDFTANAVYDWDFGLGGTLTYRGPNPTNIQWPTEGEYIVTLDVEENGCISTSIDTIRLFDRPQLKHAVPNVSGCTPLSVSFVDSSEFYGRVLHFWDFGDGQTSSEPSPVHIYTDAGVYTVSHTLTTLDGCRDQLTETFPMTIDAWPLPGGYLEVSDERASIFEPFFTIRDTTPQLLTETFVPGYGILSNLEELTFKIQDTGNYEITHITYNEYGCTDTIFKNLRVFSPLRYYIPNAFTPNGDGLNETFDVSILGVADYQIQIYDRWGKMMFESDDQQYSWNGRFNNNEKEVPIDYYWYLIQVVEKETQVRHKKEGTIRLFR